MTVTALMLALLAQISGNTLQTTRISKQHLDATQCTRMVLDALESDLSNLISENGLTAVVAQDASNNTRLAFLTRGRGPDSSGSDSSRFLAVSYELSGNEIQRKLSPIAWSTLDLMGVVTGAFTSTTSNEFGKGVLRFEVAAILDSGTTVSLSQTGAWKTSYVNGQTIASPFSALVLRNYLETTGTALHIRSLVVAVAAMDEQNLNLPNAKNMGSSLPSPTGTQTPMEAWNAAITSGSLAHYPRPAQAALHIDQRTVQLK
ncbi:MAG: hypothetical protein ACFUZC_08510 [Chthoniobacteraceae bacterium]